MNKIDRVNNIINNKEVDFPPMGFWLHFPTEVISAGIEEQVKAHIDFKKETNTDILKIMNENEMRSTDKITTVDDWKKISRLTRESSLIVNQSKILKKIVSENNEECFLLGTIHGLMASLSHASGHSYSVSPSLMQEHYKSNPDIIKEAISVISDNTQLMIDITLEAGVHGIYYAALGGEADRISDVFFKDILEKSEIKLLSKIKKESPDTPIFLHMCKENVELKRYINYPCDVINWAMHESQYDISTANKIFKDKVILGGFDDRSGELVEGSKIDIENKLKEIKNIFQDTKYIIGADCTLPTEISLERIRLVRELSKEL